MSEIVATDAETRRFLSLPEAIRERILALIYELNKQHACCKFQASMDLQLRRTLAKKYHALKKDLLDLGMDEDDTIMLRIRKEHLQFQQKMLSGDFISLQLDFSHMFEVCTAEEASTSKWWRMKNGGTIGLENVAFSLLHFW